MPRLVRPSLLALSLLALAACTTTPVTPPTVEVTQRAEITVERAAVPEPVLPAVWRLTGVAGDVVERPALAVKIENTAAARPQVGLEQADVVWETIVEFDVSRFVAVFQSQVPDEIGPIRSVRPVDPLIVAPLRGLLAYSGGQAGILALARDSGAQILSHDAGDDGFYRVSDRSAPHNVMGSPATFWAQADADHAASPGQQFTIARSPERASAVTAGSPASTLTFRLSAASNPSWTFDEGSATWLRSEGSRPATAVSGARLSAVNVVSIVAAHVPSGFGAQNGASVPTYELVGSGDAVVATGGRTLAVRWQKDAQDSPLRLVTADGAAVDLAPGNTWVELVPAGAGSLTIS